MASKTLTEMQKDLICKICDHPARPWKKQWYRCLNLHQICQDCKGKNKKCSCGEPISKEYCKMTEKLLSDKSVKRMKLNCVNMKNGCQETFAENALENHESECIYRSVPCPTVALHPNPPCGGKVIFHTMLQHYENHSLGSYSRPLKTKIIMKMNDVIISGKDCYRNPHQFELGNYTFLLSEMTNKKVVYMWVYILGSPNDAKHFSFTLKLYGKTEKSELSFKGEVAAIDDSFRAIWRSGKCFSILHSALINQFVDEDREYAYSLEIRNLKEEAQDGNYESGVSISNNDDDLTDFRPKSSKKKIKKEK